MVTRIEVHFTTPEGVEQRAVVLPNDGVQAIFLDDAKAASLLGMKTAPRRRPPKENVSVETLVSTQAVDDDARIGVCYLVNGDLFCW